MDHTRRKSPTMFYVFLGGKLVEISAISSAPKFPKIQDWKHRDMQYSQTSLSWGVWYFREPLPNKSEDSCEIWNSFLVGRLWLRGQSLAIHIRSFHAELLIWIWFVFSHHHFLSCTELQEEHANLISVSWRQNCMKSTHQFTFPRAWRL